MLTITEQTALELLQAMQQLTAAINGKNSVIPPTPTKRKVDPDYLPGGHEWQKSLSVEELIAWNREQAAKRRRKVKRS